jgi:hypothetical protein
MNTEQSPVVSGSAKIAARVRSVPHPRYDLLQAEELARRAFTMGARHCDQDAVAQALKYKNSTNGAFKGLKAAASYFGLITYRDDRYLSVAEAWIEAFHADDDALIRRLRQEAVQQPTLYQQLISEFLDRQLPNEEKLARQLFLTPKYGILKDAADTAARVFLDSVRYAGIVDHNNFLRSPGSPQQELGSESGEAQPQPSQSAVKAQQPQDALNSMPGPGATRESATAAQSADLDRVEVQLTGGRRAYLLVPVPLSSKEKERLKRYIDLMLEPEEA